MSACVTESNVVVAETNKIVPNRGCTVVYDLVVACCVLGSDVVAEVFVAGITDDCVSLIMSDECANWCCVPSIEH